MGQPHSCFAMHLPLSKQLIQPGFLIAVWIVAQVLLMQELSGRFLTGFLEFFDEPGKIG